MSVIVLGNGFRLINVSFFLANGCQLICVSYCVRKWVSANMCQLLCKQMGVSYNVPVIVLANGCQLICVRHHGGRDWERKHYQLTHLVSIITSSGNKGNNISNLGIMRHQGFLQRSSIFCNSTLITY